ncbi:uncharacterized protein V1513DRAFT_450440 [Lipomyces chichibuensis]|uniref:uncharacterized protein n=1 Tax=Lipomyces chichibuensis TaxID=1546026 RepID=UPI003343C6B2
MFASKLHRAPQRHPLNSLEKSVETWDNDSELDFEGDLFSKLSTLENQDSSSSLASSRNSRASFSFEDELMELDNNDCSHARDRTRKTVNSGIPFARYTSQSSLAGGAISKLESNPTAAGYGDWDDDIDFGDDSAMLTIKAAKKTIADVSVDIISGNLFKAPTRGSGTLKQFAPRSPRLQFSQKPPTLTTLPEMKPRQPDLSENSMEMDFEIPESLKTIELKTAIRPRTPAQLDSDIDLWGEESVNSRYASSKRDPVSNRSSMISTFSPASSVTYESEGEGLLGLEIPEGPLNFQQLLDMRLKSFSPEPPSRNSLDVAKEDFFDGLEIGDGDDIFDAGKLTVNRNVKQKSDLCQPSPQRKPVLSNVFPPKPTRIPRPVSQTSTVIPSQQHSTPTSTHQSSPPVGLAGAMNTEVSRPERRLSHKSSMITVKTNSNQMNQRHGTLLSKKSMPVLRSATTDSSFSNQPTTPTVPSIPSWLTNASTKQPNLRRMASRSGLALPLPTQQVDVTPRLKDTQHLHPVLPTYAKKLSASLNMNEVPSIARQTPSPKKDRYGHAPDSVRREAATTKTLLKPVKRRLFGDGTELDAFEDLPISTVKERTFLMKPGKGIEGLGIVNGMVDNSKAVSEKQAPSAMNLRAAMLREKPMQGRSRRKAQQRPHLIKPLGNIANASRSEKGMQYNPTTYTWEGNDTVTADFDDIALTPPRPALISNITSNKGVQIVGGMIFDPVRMCWFKAHDTMSGEGDDDQEDEDDPFAGFDDLVDDLSQLNVSTPKLRAGASPGQIQAKQKHSTVETGNVYGEFVVGEEFDVGPRFIKRQTDEEERWRRKVQGWIGNDRPGREHLYEIRRLIMNGK